MVVGEASLPSRRVVKEGDGEDVLLSCERWQLFSRCVWQWKVAISKAPWWLLVACFGWLFISASKALVEGGGRSYAEALVVAGQPPDFAMSTRSKVGILEDRDLRGRGGSGGGRLGDSLATLDFLPVLSVWRTERMLWVIIQTSAP